MSDLPRASYRLVAGRAETGGVSFLLGAARQAPLEIAMAAGLGALIDRSRLLWRAGEITFGPDAASGLLEARGPGRLALGHAGRGAYQLVLVAPGCAVDVAAGALMAVAPRPIIEPTPAGDGSVMLRLRVVSGELALALAGAGPLRERTLGPGELLDVAPGAVLAKDPSVALARIVQLDRPWGREAGRALVQCSGSGSVALGPGDE